MANRHSIGIIQAEFYADRMPINEEIQAKLLNHKPRSATALLSRWVDEGFLVTHDSGVRTRSYALADKYRKLLD